MNFNKFFSTAIIILTLLLTLSVQADSNTDGVIVEKLLETEESWDGTTYSTYPSGTPQLSILKIIIQPNTYLDWHEHPIPNAAYIQSGKLTVEKQSTGEQRILKAGEVLAEMVDITHRGYTGSEGATLIVFYAGKNGVPLSTK
jgi:quercetin dioxygenase-like cupin family protein